jgi:glycosyltransferase involved in cell wall biosynthesis
MPAALLASDLVVSASSSQPEAFGKVAIEAMAMGRPVIATRHGGSLETVRENETGWFVEPADADDLAACLRRVLTAKEMLAETGAKGQQWVQNHFTARCMCEKTIDCYRRLLEEKRKRRTGEILSVVQMLPELDSGGVERGTLEVGRYLAGRQHRSFVISGGGRLVGQLEAEGSRHVDWQVGAKSPLTLKYVLPLRRLLKNEQIDILHLRSRMPAWIGYIAWKSLPKKYRPTLVTTFHGFYSVNRYSAIMTKGEGIIAISKSIERHIREAYGVRNGIKLIFRGVDKEIFDPAAIDPSRVEQLRTAWDIDGTKPLIILPGRLTRLKGQDVFIRALAQMSNTRYQALLIGDIKDNPKFTEELTALIDEYQLADRLSLVGYCDDMPAALMLADIVVSASSNEPEAFGRTTIEAMAMGKAVVATAHGGSLETVTPGQTGWLVKPGDAADLARALDEALQSPERRAAFGRAGRELVNRTFTMKQMCEETEALYRELVDAKHRAHNSRAEMQEAELN